EQRALQFDFSPYPFTLAMRRARRMLAVPACSVLRSKYGTLNFVELLQCVPSFIAHRSGNVDLKPYLGHEPLSGLCNEPRGPRPRGLNGLRNDEQELSSINKQIVSATGFHTANKWYSMTYTTTPVIDTYIHTG